jgi:hypothetical protein
VRLFECAHLSLLILSDLPADTNAERPARAEMRTKGGL